MSTSFLCPVCGKDDAIQKVSAIVASGQASGTLSGPSGGAAYVGGKWGITGGYTTLSGSMATELAQKLAPPSEPSLGGGACLLLFFIGGGIFEIVIALSTGEIWTFPIGIVTIAIGAIPLILYFKEKPKIEERFVKAKSKWARLYYCSRDDIVFDPQTGETCHPDNLGKFLRS
jgi:hypothetical protein